MALSDIPIYKKHGKRPLSQVKGQALCRPAIVRLLSCTTFQKQVKQAFLGGKEQILSHPIYCGIILQFCGHHTFSFSLLPTNKIRPAQRVSKESE